MKKKKKDYKKPNFGGLGITFKSEQEGVYQRERFHILEGSRRITLHGRVLKVHQHLLQKKKVPVPVPYMQVMCFMNTTHM